MGKKTNLRLFFLILTMEAGLTNYVIRHMSKYDIINMGTSHLSFAQMPHILHKAIFMALLTASCSLPSLWILFWQELHRIVEFLPLPDLPHGRIIDVPLLIVRISG
jgi:hypothetical protein